MSPTTFDSAYLRKLREREPETCQHFTAHFTLLLDHVLRATLRDRELAADLRNETLYRVLRHVDREQIREPERFGAFVRRVAKIVTLEYFRKRHRLEVHVAQDLPDLADPQEAIESLIAGRQMRAMVHRAVGELAARDQRVILEVCVKGRDRIEVASELGVNLAVLRVKLHRALARLKDRITESGGAPTARGSETPRPLTDTSNTEARK